MKRLTSEEEYVFRTLKGKFDSFFDLYCMPLARGAPVRIFMQDTDINRRLMDEFKRYIEQKAVYQGWEYESKKFQVTYVPADKIPTHIRTFIANPLEENIVFEDVRDGLYFRVDKKDADNLRNKLLPFVIKSERSS